MNPAVSSALERSQLGRLTKLGAGGQGDVYHAAGIRIGFSPGVAYKEYHADWRPSVDFGALQAMIDFLAARQPDEGLDLVRRITWPVRLVCDGGLPIGFLMPEVTDEFRVWVHLPSGGNTRPLAQFQHLLNPPDILARRGILISDRARYLLLASLAETLALFDRNSIAVGDLSPKNVLFSLDPFPRCLLVDADTLRLARRTAMPQAETPDWDIRAVSSEELATPATDRYKLGLFVLRLMTGDQATRNPAGLPSGVPAPVKALVRSAVARSPASRPAAEDWIEPLADAAAAASARVEKSAIPKGKVIVPKAVRQPTIRMKPGPFVAGAVRPAAGRGAQPPLTTQQLTQAVIIAATNRRWFGSYSPPPRQPTVFQAPPIMGSGLVGWAGPWSRLLAHGLDALVLGLLFAVEVGVGLVATAGDTARLENAAPQLWVLFGLVAFAYFPICWRVLGATLGQLALAISVVHSPDGRLLDMRQALIRALALIVSGWNVLTFIQSVQADPFRRAWHDKLAESVVVQRV